MFKPAFPIVFDTSRGIKSNWLQANPSPITIIIFDPTDVPIPFS
jgi:hypothetical protein